MVEENRGVEELVEEVEEERGSRQEDMEKLLEETKKQYEDIRGGEVVEEEEVVEVVVEEEEEAKRWYEDRVGDRQDYGGNMEGLREKKILTRERQMGMEERELEVKERQIEMKERQLEGLKRLQEFVRAGEGWKGAQEDEDSRKLFVGNLLTSDYPALREACQAHGPVQVPLFYNPHSRSASLAIFFVTWSKMVEFLTIS